MERLSAGHEPFPPGAGLKRIPVADHIAYDAASIGCNWRMLARYDSLVAASLHLTLRLCEPA